MDLDVSIFLQTSELRYHVKSSDSIQTVRINILMLVEQRNLVIVLCRELEHTSIRYPNTPNDNSTSNKDVQKKTWVS